MALEPEAASICCRDLPVNAFIAHQIGGRVCFEEGTENIIVDAGGMCSLCSSHFVEFANFASCPTIIQRNHNIQL